MPPGSTSSRRNRNERSLMLTGGLVTSIVAVIMSMMVLLDCSFAPSHTWSLGAERTFSFFWSAGHSAARTVGANTALVLSSKPVTTMTSPSRGSALHARMPIAPVERPDFEIDFIARGVTPSKAAGYRQHNRLAFAPGGDPFTSRPVQPTTPGGVS